MKLLNIKLSFLDLNSPIQTIHQACISLFAFCKKSSFKIESQKWIYADGTTETSTDIDNEINDCLESGAVGYEITFQANY